MKTDDLIRSLGSEPTPVPRGFLARGIAMGLAAGLTVTILIFVLFWGVRSDLLEIARNPALLAKSAVPLVLACLASLWMQAKARPAGQSVASRIIWLIPVALILLFGMTLLTTPSEGWSMALRGKSITMCLVSIPVLSVPILIGLMTALRRGAPEHPTLCGAIVGLTAGAAAATVYSFYCIEGSPLFYSTWYSLAVLGVGAFGAAVGRQALHW